MSLTAALYDHLTGYPAIFALVGTGVYPQGEVPTGRDRPYITQQRVSTGRYPHLGGASGLVLARIQIDVWADTLESQQSVQDAVRDALDGYWGAMGNDGIAVRFCSLTDENEGYEPRDDGSQNGFHRATLEFNITYTESLPAL